MKGGGYLIEIIIVDENDNLIASVMIESKTDSPFVTGKVIEKKGYKVLVNEDPEE